MIVEGLGVRVRVVADDPLLIERVQERLPSDWRSRPNQVHDPGTTDLDIRITRDPKAESWHLCFNNQKLGSALSPEALLDTLEHHLNIGVALRSPIGIAVHAGLVSMGDRALLLPGRSFCGKSTLVAALVDAGATYESDDLVLVTPTGRVHGVPRPLNLRQGHRRVRSDPRTLGWVPNQPAKSVNRIEFLRFSPGSRWNPRPLNTASGALSLFQHALLARRDPKEALTAIAALCQRAHCYRSNRGDSQRTVNNLLDRWTGS